MAPRDFAAAASTQLDKSRLLADDGIVFVSATLVSAAEDWPVAIEVRFCDPSGDPYLWNAGDYAYTEIPGFEADGSPGESDFLVDDWSSVAAVNIVEWLAVRDREDWESVRPAVDQ